MPSFSALASDAIMAGVAHRTASMGGPRRGSIMVAPVRSIVLPTVALVELALALVLLELPGSPGAPELPAALFAVALAMLVTALLFSQGKQSVVLPADSREPPPAPVEAGPRASRPTPTPVPIDRARSGVSGLGSAWRILSSPAGPGDETWLSWLPRERRRLGAEGPVAPDVVTSPGRAGSLVAFPVRDYFGGALPPVARGSPSPVPPRARERGFVGDEHLPALSSRRASPFSEEELDRMFPPEDRRGSLFLAAAPNRIGSRSPWSNSAGFAPHAAPVPAAPDSLPGRASDKETTEDVVLASLLSNNIGSTIPDEPCVRRPDTTPIPTAADQRAARTKEDLRLEAANPIPPHLRATGAFHRTEPQDPARRGKGTSTSRSVCASCSKVVVDLRLSGPCPKCLRPLCHDCLREALVTDGHGWCLDCSLAADVVN